MMDTVHTYRDFVFTIHYEAAQPAFTVQFPDIPEIITSGESLTGAFKNACEALDLHLETLQKLGKRTPKSRHRLDIKTA